MKTLSMLLSFGLFTVAVQAADIVWTNTAGGNWSTAANWEPNQVPGAADNALITNNGTYTVTFNASATVTGFTLGGASGTQTFANSGSTLTLNGASTVGVNGAFNLSGGTLTGTADVTCSGVLTWSGGTMSGSGKTIIAGGGTLILSSNQHDLNRVLQNDGTATWTAGVVQLTGGTFNNNGSFTANSGATLTCWGGSVGGNAFNNAGTFTKLGAGLTQFTINLTGVNFNNSGSVDVQAGTLTFNSGFTQTSGQTMLSGGTVSANSTMQFQGGLLGGVGTISASVNSSGTVSPGASPGLLTITGDYTQNTNGALNIEIAGTAAGTDFDRLAVGGTATLAGALNVNLTNGFYPAANDAFTVVTAGSRSGSFANFFYPSNDVGMAVSNTPTSVFVQVINVRPVIPAIADQTLDELTLLSFNANATDADTPMQTLTYALTNSPLGAMVNGSGQVEWTPMENQGPDITNITVRVTDNGTPNLTVSRTFQVTVNEINVPAVLTLPSNPSVNEETTYTATATDADVPTNALTFALVSGPAGLTVSSAGAIDWTPGEAQGSNSYAVTVRVTDDNPLAINATSLSVTSSFNIVVNESNRPPVLGALANYTVDAGQTVSFTASATDSDLPANVLLFSLISPPSGATIDSGSGLFNWRAPAALADTTNTLQVRVTDDGAPNKSATNSFTVIINPIAPVMLTPVSYAGGQFTFSVTGPIGPDYIIMASTNLVDWLDLATNAAPATPFNHTDVGAGSYGNRSYRVRLSP